MFGISDSKRNGAVGIHREKIKVNLWISIPVLKLGRSMA